MFSNRSVSVQPSEAAMENGGMPEARIVFAAARNCFQVAGGFTPASLNDLTLYQTVDLFEALKKTPYSFLLTVPIFTQSAEKFLATTLFANVIGLSFPLVANCLMRPGCGSVAMSGGLPPCRAVDTICGVLSPAPWY